MASHLHLVRDAHSDEGKVELPATIPAVKRTVIDNDSQALWSTWKAENKAWAQRIDALESVPDDRFLQQDPIAQKEYFIAKFALFAAADEKQYIQCKDNQAALFVLKNFAQYFQMFSKVEPDRTKVLLEIHNLARYVKALKSLVIADLPPTGYEKLTSEQKNELIQKTVDVCTPLAGFGVGGGLSIEDRMAVWKLVKQELGSEQSVIASKISANKELAEIVPDLFLAQKENTSGQQSGPETSADQGTWKPIPGVSGVRRILSSLFNSEK